MCGQATCQALMGVEVPGRKPGQCLFLLTAHPWAAFCGGFPQDPSLWCSFLPHGKGLSVEANGPRGGWG